MKPATKKKSITLDDGLLYTGSLSLVAGASLYSHPLGLVVLGVLLLIPPALKVAVSFIRGVRS